MHDLKSPAIGIGGLTRLLQRQYEGLLDDRGRVYCDQIMKASEHLVALVEKINTYIATKEVPLKVEQIDVGEVLDGVKAEFSAVLNARRITWVEPEGLPKIRADRLSMTRVFRNLVDNALKYGGQQLGEIGIGYEGTEDFHTFSVSDNGVGLKGDAEKIFGAFHRNEAAKGIEGAGLGLSIVREVAEKHGGTVWLGPGDKGGATFFFSIGKKVGQI
jgi:light-regulated signal transduction histidine kinase (bacteriophytochrome)